MTKRRSKQIVALLTAVVIASVSYGQQQGWFGAVQETATKNQPGLYSVSRFVDGDTIVVDMDGHEESIRMIGIDTPETHKPNTPVQCYGPAASAYAKNLIGQHKIRLESDPQSQNRDRYKRLLRYVYLPDGRLVAEEIVKNGYGFVYRQFPFTKSEAFIAGEAAAEAGRKGLWGTCTVTVQPNGRKQTNTVE